MAASACSLIAAINPWRSNLATKSLKPARRTRSIISGVVIADSAITGISRSRRRTALAKRETVHPRHIQIGHDDIEHTAAANKIVSLITRSPQRSR